MGGDGRRRAWRSCTLHSRGYRQWSSPSSRRWSFKCSVMITGITVSCKCEAVHICRRWSLRHIRRWSLTRAMIADGSRVNVKYSRMQTRHVKDMKVGMKAIHIIPNPIDGTSISICPWWINKLNGILRFTDRKYYWAVSDLYEIIVKRNWGWTELTIRLPCRVMEISDATIEVSSFLPKYISSKNTTAKILRNINSRKRLVLIRFILSTWWVDDAGDSGDGDVRIEYFIGTSWSLWIIV